MSVDFPRAWVISRATPAAEHHPKCSFRTIGLLCDCDVLMKHPDVLDDVLQTLDSTPIRR